MEHVGKKAVVIIWQGCFCFLVSILEMGQACKKTKIAAKAYYTLKIAAFCISALPGDDGVIGDIQLAQFAFLILIFWIRTPDSGERCCLEKRTWEGETQCVRALHKLDQGRYQ